MTEPKPPETLSKGSQKLWRDLQKEYRIDDPGGLLILASGLQARDRMLQAQLLIHQEGMQVADRFGQMKAHPLLVTERDSRAAMMAALKALNLDLEPLRSGPGRPPGSR